MNFKFMKNIRIFIFSFLSLLVAAPVMAATKANVNTSRVFEDGVWVVVFVIIIMFSSAMYKAMEGGFNNARNGYSILLLSGITGFFWKFLGFLKRGFGLNHPEWLFELTREIFEGITGLLFAVAFIVLFISISRKK